MGTQLPFDRLTRAMDDWCGRNPDAEVMGQIARLGSRNHRPAHFRWCEKMPPDAFEEAFLRARFVVAHAGMGVIITALTQGKPLVVMPRRADLREHRNDHQLATAERFGLRPGLTVVDDAAGLHAALDRLHGRAAGAIGDFAPDHAAATFTDAIRDFLLTGRKDR